MSAASVLSGSGKRTKKTHGEGTAASGYEEHGPYHCEDCQYLRKPGTPDKEHGLCPEKHVLKDPDVPTHKPTGLKIVNLERGCCYFVKQGPRKEHTDED